MMNSNEASVFRSELHKLAAEIGPKLEQCKDGGQLSCGCHLVQARESLFAALRSFNPKIDEREPDLKF